MQVVFRVLDALTRAGRRARRTESGQTTAEYALVILAAAAVAALVLAWAARTHAIARLFDVTIGKVIDQVG